MSALETAVKTALQNVIQSLVEKHLGDKLPEIMARFNDAIEKVGTFDQRLTSIQNSQQEILYRMNLQASGGPSIAEQITFGSENIIHETADGVDKGFTVIDGGLSEKTEAAPSELERMKQQLRTMENDGNDSERGASNNGSGDAPRSSFSLRT